MIFQYRNSKHPVKAIDGLTGDHDSILNIIYPPENHELNLVNYIDVLIVKDGKKSYPPVSARNRINKLRALVFIQL